MRRRTESISASFPSGVSNATRVSRDPRERETMLTDRSSYPGVPQQQMSKPLQGHMCASFPKHIWSSARRAEANRVKPVWFASGRGRMNELKESSVCDSLSRISPSPCVLKAEENVTAMPTGCYLQQLTSAMPGSVSACWLSFIHNLRYRQGKRKR